jgi:hypothetical protein
VTSPRRRSHRGESSGGTGRRTAGRCGNRVAGSPGGGSDTSSRDRYSARETQALRPPAKSEPASLFTMRAGVAEVDRRLSQSRCSAWTLRSVGAGWAGPRGVIRRRSPIRSWQARQGFPSWSTIRRRSAGVSASQQLGVQVFASQVRLRGRGWPQHSQGRGSKKPDSIFGLSFDGRKLFRFESAFTALAAFSN